MVTVNDKLRCRSTPTITFTPQRKQELQDLVKTITHACLVDAYMAMVQTQLQHDNLSLDKLGKIIPGQRPSHFCITIKDRITKVERPEIAQIFGQTLLDITPLHPYRGEHPHSDLRFMQLFFEKPQRSAHETIEDLSKVKKLLGADHPLIQRALEEPPLS